MSDSNVTNVDLPVVKAVIGQLGDLSTALGDLAREMDAGGDLSWTGADPTGTELYKSLAPADQGGVQAVTATKQAVDGLIDSLGTTAGLWGKTEGANVELNQ